MAAGTEQLATRGASLRARLAVSPELYKRITFVAVCALSLIVLTGAAVRLTGSGLGCPDWPKCYGRTIPPIQFHTVIEFGNRIVTALVGIVVIAASGMAFFRRPTAGIWRSWACSCPSALWARPCSAGWSCATTSIRIS